MRYVDADRHTVLPGQDGPCAPAIYVIDAPEHPFDIEGLADGHFCSIAKVCVCEWNDSLTPWPAQGLYRGESAFGGDARTTLVELLEEAIPAIERTRGLVPSARAICGYSLGGLFSLYALTHSAAFAACACLSGSVWYEGWVDYLAGLDIDGAGRFAYLSIGSKEKHAAPVILHSVQDKMAACVQVLQGQGFEVEYRVGPGNHMAHIPERFAAGLAALDGFLRRASQPQRL